MLKLNYFVYIYNIYISKTKKPMNPWEIIHKKYIGKKKSRLATYPKFYDFLTKSNLNRKLNKNDNQMSFWTNQTKLFISVR